MLCGVKSMLDDVVAYLADPRTGESLQWCGNDKRVLTTESGRHYDVARQGYVTLFGAGRAFPGDNAHMVMNRDTFLASGLYAPLARRIAAHGAQMTMSSDQHAPVIVDMGAGTGYYTHELQRAVSSETRIIAADISVPAAKRLAKLDGHVGAIVADVWQRWPIKDACADLVMHVFAPRNPAEAARVLRPGGGVLVVAPSQRHLQELVAAGIAVHVDSQKADRLRQGFIEYFDEVDCDLCEWTITPTRSQIEQIITMGPSSYHSDTEKVSAAAAELAAVHQQITCSVEIRQYKRKDS